jgi:NADH-quinone oxidoreductase subunit C
MDSIADRVREALADRVASIESARDALVLRIAPAALVDVATRLRDDLAFDLLVDITAIDWIGQAPRFETVHQFYSTRYFDRVRVKARLPEADPTIDSLVPLYGSARFMERECRDMYGIVFAGHPDPRPILLYEGFVGHPLRRDYPKDREQPLVRYRDRTS